MVDKVNRDDKILTRAPDQNRSIAIREPMGFLLPFIHLIDSLIQHWVSALTM